MKVRGLIVTGDWRVRKRCGPGQKVRMGNCQFLFCVRRKAKCMHLPKQDLATAPLWKDTLIIWVGSPGGALKQRCREGYVWTRSPLHQSELSVHSYKQVRQLGLLHRPTDWTNTLLWTAIIQTSECQQKACSLLSSFASFL